MYNNNNQQGPVQVRLGQHYQQEPVQVGLRRVEVKNNCTEL